MTQREAVIQTLERLGGIATLGTLYHEVFKITECTWKTKMDLFIFPLKLTSFRRLLHG